MKLLPAFLAMAGSLAAQTPAFTGIVNGASGIPPGLPSYGIAQGSIFVIYGSNLGAAAPSGSVVNSAPLPLPTTAGLSGTAITVTVGTTTVPAPILYTSPTQVAGVMPSTTPVGTGTLTLTYNGKSGSGPVTVLASAFGISNMSTPGGHQVALLTFGANPGELVLPNDSAAPGDIVVLFGTGLGPIGPGGNDTGYPLAGNLPITPPTVYVGGVASPSVPYYGRSPCCAGLDQIAFVIPQNAPLGCNVSLIVQTSNGNVPIVSNGPSTAIAATDHAPCADPVSAYPPALLSKSSVKILGISLQQNVAVNSVIPVTPVPTDTFQILATQLTQAQFFALSFAMAESSNNSCFTGFVPASGGGALPPATALDAGTSITLTPPSGSPITIPAAAPGAYLGKSSAGISPGMWSFKNSGGANEGPVSFNFPIPQPIVWTNEASLIGATVDRTKGLTITWTGGDANGYIDIQGFAANSTGNFLVGYDCSAPISAGSFTIPPSVLLEMPTGPSSATLQVSTFALPFTIPSVTGFDAVVNFSQLQTIIPIVYK